MVDARDAEDTIRAARDLDALRRDRSVPRTLRIEASTVLAMFPV